MEPQMIDEEQPVFNQTPENEAEQNQQNGENSEDKKKLTPARIIRRPGRPSLRGRGRLTHVDSGRAYDSEKDQDYQIVKTRTQNRNLGTHEQSNMEGFIRIIDYLKKIDCDEASLHNKMNPYNLLTPTCFWYIISAEYFSFDFFNNRNPNDAAIEILRKAQKTFIVLPQRILKPLRVQGCLQFQTEQLRQASKPITDRLTNLIKPPMLMNADGTQKASYITNVSEDDLFRSSTRAIIFNYLKKKIQTNQKWSTQIKPVISNIQGLPEKQMEYYIMNIIDEEEDRNKILGTEMLYRQKRKINPDSTKNIARDKNSSSLQNRKSKSKNKNKIKKSRRPIHNSSQANNSAARNGDQMFFHESDEQQARQHNKQPENQDQIVEEEQQDEIIQEECYDHEEHQQLQYKQIKQQMEEQNNNEVIKEQDDMQEEQAQIKQQIKQQDMEIKQEVCEQVQEEENLDNNNLSHKDEEEEDEEIDKPVVRKNCEKFTKVYTQDDLLLDSILHLPLDNIISLLQASLTPIQLPPITKDPLPMPKNDPLDLVYQTHCEEQRFLEYMKDRQEKIYLQKMKQDEKLEQKQRETQVEDAKCQVCTDGDYTDDNLIVFCSMCGISVHQRCVGLNKVPAENWICQVCIAFGPAGCNVPCPLCNVKGGALKRTSIHINQPLFKDTNPAYHQYSKGCPFLKQKQEYIPNKNVPEHAQPEPYYDYFTKSSYNSELPVCHYVWVHYVCAIWVPQCYFEQKNGSINIKGVQNIDKRRFKQKCLVCHEIRAGACVKCDNSNCTKYYHSECARKRKVYMQQLNLDKLRYLIFCEAHEPLKVKRKIEIKKKKSRDEIVKFCRGIQKYVETYKIAPINFKLMKSIGTMDKMDKNFDGKDRMKGHDRDQEDMKAQARLQKNTDEDFIRDVIEALLKTNIITINLIKIDNNRYKIEQIVKPSKRDMRKSLNRIEQFWKQFNNGRSPETNLKHFNNIMRQNFYLKQKIENFINYGETKESRPQYEKRAFSATGSGNKKGPVGRRRKIVKETVIEQEGGIFCVCRKPYQGQVDMFQCEVCNEWYHHECIGFIGSQIDAESLDFHCMKCMKYQSEQDRAARIDKCGKFFSVDSLFLNYRPPTPSLQSQDQEYDAHLAQNRQRQKNPQESEKMVNGQDKQYKSPEKNSLSKEEERLQKQQKNGSAGKTKILAILDKPFVVEGPFLQRQDNLQFYENKKNKMKRQSNKSALSSNIVQMESISFKGQFIPANSVNAAQSFNQNNAQNPIMNQNQQIQENNEENHQSLHNEEKNEQQMQQRQS